LHTKHVAAHETRFSGQAIVVSRYGEANRKSVIIHPDDFDLFERYRRMFGEREPYEMRLTDTAIQVSAITPLSPHLITEKWGIHFRPPPVVACGGDADQRPSGGRRGLPEQLARAAGVVP